MNSICLPNSLTIIIGGTGFIGSALAKRLQDLQIQHLVVTRQNTKNALIPSIFTTLVRGDITDHKQEWVNKVIEYIQTLGIMPKIYLINCGGLVSSTATDFDYKSQNLVAVTNLIAAAKILKVTRFVHLSSSSIYFSLEDRLNICENQVDPKKIIGSYALSKWSSEQEFVKDSKSSPSGFEIVALRPQLVYGPEEQVFLPHLLTKAATSGLPKTSGKGPITSMTARENLVDAILLSLTKPMSNRMNIYNITDGKNINLFDTIEYLCEILKIPFRTFRIPRSILRYAAISAEKLTSIRENAQGLMPGTLVPPFTKVQCAMLTADRTLNIDRAIKELEYQPQIDPMLGLKEFALALRDKKWSP